MIGTFIFASLILSVKFHNGANDGAVNCFLVGMCLYAVLNMVGGISGGAINPAVGLCQCTFQYIAKLSHPDPKYDIVEYEVYAWVYVVGTFTGGALAGIF